MSAVLDLEGLRLGVAGRTLFDDLSVNVASGESLSILGPSGSGKTSLLNCVAGIKTPESGHVRYRGSDLFSLRPAARSRLRLAEVGMVFQFSELLPELTITENVALPLRLNGVGRSEAQRAAVDCLTALGLDEVLGQRPDTLSGGEQQRVGIARATVHSPRLILADEPTGMLDDQSTATVMRLLLRQVADLDAALVLVTHDSQVASMTSRTVRVDHHTLVPVDDPSRTQ